ncbi:cytochrome c [Oxalobacteraceae bacterium R-40]|uniref:Cytochrome c n=1 Tax=Keguizhuia sedimenti TaxID=3064264 RepID=A0ABU1BT30_9BURK|nr:cytochrome c [Oxalobacteraceae bacterium R-40]
MSTMLKPFSLATVIAISTLFISPLVQSAPFGFGKPITETDTKEFVSPLPDGRGLPVGKGTAIQGKELYQAQCVACHGAKLEGGIGDRLIGGRDTLINNDPTKKPVKTVESYWPYATTLFDYIKRAMPLPAPGSLSNDNVYALSAYILSEAKIIDSTMTLDQNNLAKVQMPNQNGFVPDKRPEKFQPIGKTNDPR